MVLQAWMERALDKKCSSAARRMSFTERLLGTLQTLVR